MLQWLCENDEVSLEFLYSAYARDKKDKVKFRTLRLALLWLFICLIGKRLSAFFVRVNKVDENWLKVRFFELLRNVHIR